MVERLTGHAMYAPVITALFTGVRRGELLALRWCNVDLDSADRHFRCLEPNASPRFLDCFANPDMRNGRRGVPQSAAVRHYVDPCVNKVAGVGVAQRMKGYPPDPGL